VLEQIPLSLFSNLIKKRSQQLEKKMNKLVFALTLGLSAIAAAPVSASIVTIDFSGEISSLTTGGVAGAPTLDPVFSIGDAVSGTAIYDASAVQTVASATRGSYGTALQSISVTMGGLVFSATGGNTTVYNDDATFDDALSLDGVTGVSGPTVGGLSASRVKLHLRTSNVLTALTSLLLPDAAGLGSLIANNTGDGNINFVAFDNGETVRYNLLSIQATDSNNNNGVPAPTPIALLAFGLAALGVSARRRGR